MPSFLTNGIFWKVNFGETEIVKKKVVYKFVLLFSILSFNLSIKTKDNNLKRSAVFGRSFFTIKNGTHCTSWHQTASIKGTHIICYRTYKVYPQALSLQDDLPKVYNKDHNWLTGRPLYICYSLILKSTFSMDFTYLPRTSHKFDFRYIRSLVRE